jgi:hypothetical protein
VKLVDSGGDGSHVLFGEKLPGQEGSVKRCVVVMQQPVFCRQSLKRSFRTFFSVTAKCGSSISN